MANAQQYSDEDLKVFETLISTKLEKAYEQLKSLQLQIIEMEESIEDSSGVHYMNDGGYTEQIGFTNAMVIRQQKHTSDLEKALMRIKNKSYGRCIITGELIDKKRLLAVLTTTKSMAAKTQTSTSKINK